MPCDSCITQIIVPFVCIQASAQGAGNADYKKATSIYDFTAVGIDGNQVSLDKYKY